MTDNKTVKNSSDDQDQTDVKQKIRIKVKAFDHKIIDRATRTIIDTAKRTNTEIKGPVPLPTEKTKFTVNRSTFVHKDSRE